MVLNPKCKVYGTTKEFEAVATATGTLGWQAVMNKVPVLMFGEYFYKDAPEVYRISTSIELSVQ